MGLFDKLFGKKGNGTESAVSEGGRNQSYEAQLEKHYSLRHINDGWSYDGKVNQDYATKLGDPELCMAVLKALRPSLRFDQVCIVTGKPVTIVCNSAPPLCIVTKLSAKGIAELIATIIKSNGKQVFEYQGAWLLKLP